MAASCLSPVNLSAPMSSFFIKPANAQGVRYLPFTQEQMTVTISTVSRQPRGPPAPKTPVRGTPAPVNVARSSGWRGRAPAGPVEMPPRSPPTPKSAGKRKGSRRAGSKSPSVSRSRSPSADAKVPERIAEVAEPAVEAAASVESAEPAARVYDITYLLCLSTSPLVGVTDKERTHMEDLVYNHTWRRGPHQSLSRSSSRSSSCSSSRASSRASSPAPSSRAPSPAPSASAPRFRQGHRRTSSKLCNATFGEEVGTD